jgi:hypothetical protein
MWEVGLPPSPVEFSSLCHSTSFPAPGCWVCTPAPPGASLDRPSLFIYNSGKDSPPLLFGAQCAPPSLQCVFIVLIAYYSVSLFSLAGGWSVQGAMLFWPRVVCGSTVYHLAHLVHVFPSRLGAGACQPLGALLVSSFKVKWRFSGSAGGVRVQSFASSGWFCLQGVSPAFLQDFTIGGMLSASSL